jgi:hypothetical protein
VATLALLVCVGIESGSALAAERESKESVLAAATHIGADECFDCVGGTEIGCASTEHRDGTGLFAPYFKTNSHGSGCTPSQDPDMLCGEHDWCGAYYDELVATAASLVRSRDAERLAEFVFEHRSRLRLSVHSSSIVVVACDGTDGAKVSLDKAVLDQLASTTRRGLGTRGVSQGS